MCAHEIHAGLARHIHVAQNEGVGSFFHSLASFAGFTGQGDMVPMGFEQIAQQATNGLFIVYDQDIAVVEERRLAGFLCDNWILIESRPLGLTAQMA